MLILLITVFKVNSQGGKKAPHTLLWSWVEPERKLCSTVQARK